MVEDDKPKSPSKWRPTLDESEFERLYGGRKLAPREERTIRLAILEDALYAYKNNIIHYRDSRERKEFLEAEEWIFEDTVHTYSFEDCCEAVGWDPGWVRGQLLKWKKKLEETPEASSPKKRQKKRVR